VPLRVWLGSACIGLGLALHQKSALSEAYNAARLKSM